MYLPSHFEEKDLATLHGLIRAHPLATLVTVTEDGLVANHVPFMIDATQGPFGTLRAHVARANPVWGHGSSTPWLLIFQGAESYISPSWYPSKQIDGKVVPTWNYATVHAHGVPQIVQDKAALLALVSALTTIHEGRQPLPWAVSDAPTDHVDRLLGAIVGIEIPITSIQGKWKVSQNHPRDNRQGVVAGLTKRGAPDDLDMATLVQRFIPPAT